MSTLSDTNRIARVLIPLIFMLPQFAVLGQPSAFWGDEARRRELMSTKPLVEKGDFSPIDAAFARKDSELLWGYFNGGGNGPIYQVRARITNDSLQYVKGAEAERMKRIIATRNHVGNYLKQLPGHARLIGDMIDHAADMAMTDSQRRHWFECLNRLGSDECIEQLGRFLFDERCPDYFGPGGPSAGAFSDVGQIARAKLFEVLRERKMLPEGMDAQSRWNAEQGARISEWWLSSAAAAPYRRMLADAGVVLPPGYPPMAELEGAKTTIAPMLELPPRKRYARDPEAYMAEYRINQKKWHDAYNRADYGALVVRKSGTTNTSAMDAQTRDLPNSPNDGKPSPGEPAQVSGNWPVLGFMASLIILAVALAAWKRKRP